MTLMTSTLSAAEIRIVGLDSGDLLAVNGTLPVGIVATAYDPSTGILRLEGRASHADYETAIRQVVFSTDDAPGDRKRIQVSVFDGQSWSNDATAFIDVMSEPDRRSSRRSISTPTIPPVAERTPRRHTRPADRRYRSPTPTSLITDDAHDDRSRRRSTILGYSLHPGDTLSIAGTLPAGITASTYNPFTGVITLSGAASLADYQTALRQVVFSSTLGAPSTADRGIQVTVNDGSPRTAISRRCTCTS